MKRRKLKILLLVICIHSHGYAQSRADTANAVRKNDSATVQQDCGWLSVRSNPVGAEVYDGSTFLGVTPLDSVTARVGMHTLRLFYPSARFWNSLSATDTVSVSYVKAMSKLVQLGTLVGHTILGRQSESTETNPRLFLASLDREDAKAWSEYAAGATMILSGTLSAYLKTNSDNYFDSYVANRDPNLLSKVRRLDQWAGVSLIISELSFGVLTYLLLSD